LLGVDNVELKKISYIIIIMTISLIKKMFMLLLSGVARGRGKWAHALQGTGLGGASTHFIQPFKIAF